MSPTPASPSTEHGFPLYTLAAAIGDSTAKPIVGHGQWHEPWVAQ